MNTGRLAVGSLLLTVLLAGRTLGAPVLPVQDDKPIPVVDTGGPSAAITALAFGEDGQTLYMAGLDKVVRVWRMQQGRFVPWRTYRVPVGPGNAGGINAVALSPDGAWVALAGRAPMRGETGFRLGRIIVEAAALSAEQMRDAGVIYVASTANPAGGKVLRGHRGEVRALAFAPGRKGKPPLLVSAATERAGPRRFGGLRLWDLSTAKLLAERNDLPARDTRPGLAVWHTGAGATQVRVAVAWPEEDARKQGYLRLWDPSPGAIPLQRWEANPFTQTAALLGPAEAPSVLTGGLGPEGGRLRTWRFNSDRDTQAQLGREVIFPRRGGVRSVPRALAVSSGRVAVVLEPGRRDANFRLALVDWRSGEVAANVALDDSDKTQLPAVAVSGSHIAVAATRNHAVRLYAIADLLQGKTEPQAILTGDGLGLRQVTFADRGRALRLGDNLLFDLDKRQVRADRTVADDTPAAGAWSVAIDEDRKGVSVQQGQKKLPPLRLPGGHDVVTAVALRPPGPGRLGVLAVAYTERDAARTLILLCDPTIGKPYRLLVGHLQDVAGLAFSASRPLLASVADDRTVCVWSLVDLDRAVGQVPGLGVSDDTNKVVVHRVERGSAAARVLAVGDVLEKIGTPGGAARPVKDIEDFLLTVSARRPGDRIAVTVAGKGVVQLPVERGVDERKPLFSLLLLGERRQPRWLGWSPAGPYDASGPTAEAHLGWHTNTGDPAAPVSFVAARVHRNDYYRQGILRYLAAEGDLARALQKWDADHRRPPPRPALRPLRPDDTLPTERVDVYLARQPVKQLRVGINEDYPLEDRHTLRWRLTRADGGKVKGGAAEAAGQAQREGREWPIDLPSVDWRRGAYRLQVELLLAGKTEALDQKTLTLRFQPPAPVLTLRQGDRDVTTTEQKPAEVMEDRLVLKVLLQAPAGQPVEVRFAQARNGQSQKNAPAARVQTGPGDFEQEFKLQEGLNRLSVRAVNRGALAGHEEEEASAAEVWVKYKAPRELPPRFTGLHLESEPEVKRLDGEETWVVNRSTVRLTGTIEAEGTLARAEWSLVGGAWKSLLPPGEKRAAPVSIDLKLKAGEAVRLRLRARSKHSDDGTTARRIVFQPPLPAVTIAPLAGQDFLTEKVALAGTFQAATEDEFKLLFRVTSAEGKAKSFEAELDRKTGKWKVELALFLGVNTVEGSVANRWRGRQGVEGTLALRYRRPPRITAHPQKVEAVETNKVKLALTVEGPAGRPLTGIKVNDALVPFDAGKPQERGGRWEWRVALPEVFVNDGERNLSEVSLQAVTDEGDSPKVVVRVVHKKLPRPPLARFLRPATSDTARRPTYTVSFRVESASPLEKVEIRRSGTTLFRADLKKAERAGKLHVLEEEATLTLTGGVNVLELVAVNADGRSPRAEVPISYTPPAVLVMADRIELVADNGEVQRVLKPTSGRDRELTFPEAPRSQVWLVGRVRWSDPAARALDDHSLEVVARVGDCRQFPVALGPRGRGDQANERPFRVPLVLIGSKNRIRIEVPSVGQQERSRREFELACAAPAGKQRLHVLVVGINVKDAAELKKRVLDALAVDPGKRPPGAQGEFFKKPPFERCVLYHVLAGEVDRSMVEGQLVEINREIGRLKRQTGWLNDLVLIYYQGEDVVLAGKGQRWLKTSRNLQFPRTPVEEFAIPCHALPRVPGAPLLLLNVAAASGPRVLGRDWGGDPGTGLLRYACDDPTEACSANPALLGLLQEAIHKKTLLGDVVKYVNEAITRQKKGAPSFSPLVVLDQDQAGRRISALDR